MAGRPTTFDASVAERAISLVADGHSLRAACAAVGLAKSTLQNWAFSNRGEIQEAYKRAIIIRALLMLDEVREIADDSRNDWIEGPSGPVLNAAHLQRCKARIDYRLRHAARHLPAHLGGESDPGVGRVHFRFIVRD